MTDLDFPALRALREAGTPGPWTALGPTVRDSVGSRVAQTTFISGIEDAPLIVAAVNALVPLIERVEEHQQHNLTAMHEYRVQVRRAERAEKSVREITERLIEVEKELADAAKHPHKGPADTDASMLLAAATRLEGGYEPGGSHTKQTVARVLRAVAALLPAQPDTEGV